MNLQEALGVTLFALAGLFFILEWWARRAEEKAYLESLKMCIDCRILQAQGRKAACHAWREEDGR